MKKLAILKSNLATSLRCDVSDCFVCAFRPILNSLSIYKGFCPHADVKYFAIKPHFRYNKVVLTSFIILLLLVAVINIISFIQLFGTCHDLTKEICIFAASELVFTASGLILSILFISKSQVRIRELNGWAAILNSKPLKSTIWPTDQQRRFVMKSFIIRHLIAVWLCLLFGTMLYRTRYDFLAYFTRFSTSFFSGFVQTLIVYIFSQQSQFLKLLSQSVDKFVQKKMNKRHQDFLIVLKQYQKFIIARQSNFQHLNQFLDPINLIWCLFLLIILIMGVYTLINYWNSDNGTVSFFYTQIRTCTTIFLFAFLINRVDGETYNQDMISYLFKYPLADLSQSEALQVEHLISTLSTNKPILKASNAFTIGMRLLAAISGTVITYVLVALQFQPSWTK